MSTQSYIKLLTFIFFLTNQKKVKNFNWNSIRSINGSQQEGFEELVCQLARNEKINNLKQFVRKGTPDAGVECFWTLEDGSEIAWQAKFFLTPLTTTQWSEIDNSVKTVLEKHPKVNKYYIAIPQNRADARLEGQTSFLEKWETRVDKWTQLAKAKGLSVEFQYEGTSELLNKLSLPINIGKLHFWFNKNEFTNPWFSKQNKNQIINLGARYSPELNVDLDVKYVFEGLYFNPSFKNKISKGMFEVNRAFADYLQTLKRANLTDLYQEDHQLLEECKAAFIEINILETGKLSRLNSAYNLLYLRLASKSKDVIERLNNSNEKDSGKKSFEDLIDKLHECQSEVSHFDSDLVENPFLLIEGEAGRGKSHLISDVISEKIKENQFSILLLGQHFKEGSVWDQILQELGLNCTKEEFLGAINSKAECSNSRIIIYIDALNEGEGKKIWKDRLSGIINEVREYKFLGMVFTIRSTYKDLVLPDNIFNEIKHFEHLGFGANTSIAVKQFFDHYNIEEPPVPILNPEFSNPLFLKLFCKGLHDNQVRKIPEGYSGLTTIFKHVIDAANRSLGLRLDYDCKSFNLVEKSINILIEEILKSSALILKKETAYEVLTNKLNSHVSDSRKILSELINENILNENVYYNEDTQKYDTEIIYFSYERFGDHLIINSIVNEELDSLRKCEKITSESKLFNYVKDESSIIRNGGFVEALSIQLPEKIGKELHEVIVDKNTYYVGKSFLESLLWRKSDTINEKLLTYVKGYILTINGLRDSFFEKLIQLSIKKDNFFNAKFLKSFLFHFDLNKRDFLWTVHINDMYFEGSSMKTLIDWVKDSQTVMAIDVESRELLGNMLTWFLVSTNKALRDNSTKALIRLYDENLIQLKPLLDNFEQVNDPYIIERLYAVSYGCVIRSCDNIQTSEFSKYIYDVYRQQKVD